jgi:LuxR family maltose regulon positive regulatory protein
VERQDNPGSDPRRTVRQRDFPLAPVASNVYTRALAPDDASRRDRSAELLAAELAGSKLRVPRDRPEIVVRERLLQRLRDHNGTTVIVAPPGFGKSTLAANWSRADDRTFAWLSLDRSDNDPVVLWSGILSAFREAGAARFGVAAAVSDGADLISQPIPRLLNAIEGDGSPFVLVLDDYHRITTHSSNTSIEFLVEHAPPNLTVALLARIRPALPLSQVRARGDLLELDASDLTFTREETRRFLNERLDSGLSEPSLDILHTRTEGWPAGLYLAHLSLRAAPDVDASIAAFGGSTRHISDYLSEVVLDSLDERTREFLLATAILDRLNGPLCDTVTGRDDSAVILDDLARSNLFLVPLDDRREWYRYHRLFAELLNDALRRRHPRLVAELHRRAKRWFEAEGDGDSAIRHAIASGDLEQATELVSEHYLPTIEWGGSGTVARWLELFPRRWVNQDPRLSIVEAWVASFHNRREQAEMALTRAATLRYEGPMPDGASSLAASIVLLRAGFPWNDVGAMLAAARQAHRLEGEHPSPWMVTVHVQLGWALCLSGHFDEARPYLERAAELAPSSGQWLNAFGATCSLAWVYLTDGDLDRAEQLAREAIRIAESHGSGESPPGGWGHSTLGAVLASLGRWDEAEHQLVRAVELLRNGGQSLLLIQALLRHAGVRRSVGDISGARALVSEAHTMVRGFSDAGILAEQLDHISHLVAHVPGEGASTTLTEREFEVIRLLEQGLSQREIAGSLFLSYNTIHSHVRSIYRKLGASSRDDAVARARERALL